MVELHTVLSLEKQFLKQGRGGDKYNLKKFEKVLDFFVELLYNNVRYVEALLINLYENKLWFFYQKGLTSSWKTC